MDYVIVSNENSKVVEKRVMYYLQIDYILAGGLAVTHDSYKNKTIYTQALTKEVLTQKTNTNLPRRPKNSKFKRDEWTEEGELI